MQTSSKTLIDLENKFWQSMVDQDPDTAVSLLSEPALMVSAHGAMKFDHAAYRKMADQGSQVLTSFELRDVEVVFPQRHDGDPDLPGQARDGQPRRVDGHDAGDGRHVDLGAVRQRRLALRHAHGNADRAEAGSTALRGMAPCAMPRSSCPERAELVPDRPFRIQSSCE
jgi:hypothetical protein